MIKLKLINLSNEKEKIKTMYRVVCLISSIIIAVIVIYGIVVARLQGVNVIGETLVNAQFPPVTIFPWFHAKLVTWLIISMLAFWFSFLELNKERISRLPKSIRQVFMLFAFILASIALYEVLFNFTLWGSLMAAGEILGELNPDQLINPFPNPEVPWNLVYATKSFFVMTIIFFYTFYFLKKIES